MKNIKIIGISVLIIVALVACRRFKDTYDELRIEFGIYCDEIYSQVFFDVKDFELDGVEYDVGSAEVFSGTYYSEFTTDVPYSYTVHEGDPAVITAHSGTLAVSAFLTGQKNQLKIVRMGNTWQLLLNGLNADVGGGGTVTYNCVSGNCDAVSGTGGQYSSYSACASACGVSVTTYDCASGNCNPVSGTGGQYSTLAQCESACTGGGGETEIVNTAIEGSYQVPEYFSFTVPSGVTSMKVLTKETVGVAAYNHTDLFVKRSDWPSSAADPHVGPNVADCFMLSINRQRDSCIFYNPPAGICYVMLYSYNGTHFESNLVVTVTQ